MPGESLLRPVAGIVADSELWADSVAQRSRNFPRMLSLHHRRQRIWDAYGYSDQSLAHSKTDPMLTPISLPYTFDICSEAPWVRVQTTRASHHKCAALPLTTTYAVVLCLRSAFEPKRRTSNHCPRILRSPCPQSCPLFHTQGHQIIQHRRQSKLLSPHSGCMQDGVSLWSMGHTVRAQCTTFRIACGHFACLMGARDAAPLYRA